jgi:ATPase family protein associated with various cellular activities (AAA)/winged helix domain-containing protein
VTRSAEWRAANQRHLAAALDDLRRLLVDDGSPSSRAEWTLPEAPAIRAVQDGFGLSGFERDVLVMCAGVELDTSFARACAEAHGDPDRTWASFGLALSRLPDAHWSALSPAEPLRAHRLVSLSQPDSVSVSPLRVAERVLHAIVGLDYLDPAIQPFTLPHHPPARGLAPRGQAVADRLARHWSESAAPPVVVRGRHRAELLAVATAACAGTGRRAVVLDAAALPTDPRHRDDLVALCARESTLCATAWLLDLTDADSADADAVRRAGIRFVDGITAPVAVLTHRSPPANALPHLTLEPSTVAERVGVWRTAAPDVADDEAVRLAVQFDLDPATVAAVVAERAVGEGSLWQGCQVHARPGLDAVAEHVRTSAGWDDIVLPPHQLDRLRELVAHVRHRHLVLDVWGFGGVHDRGLGTAALFAGPSGTGKTLAAEVVAGELGLDLYRVDISRVVSKYIGETEKNLARVFDAADAGGAVLLFDEADALFGKRGEVRDSRDRYANLEVGYLLSRIETYRGLAVLTTNLKDSLDHAFQRRLRFIVDFPFPDAHARAGLWRAAFPADTPTADLDPDLLAQLTISGASIRNTALFAAFLAAESGGAVGMRHVLAAARTEYAKLDRQLTGSEVAGWPT